MADDNEVARDARELGLELQRTYGLKNCTAGTLLAHITNGLNTIAHQAMVGESEELRRELDGIRRQTAGHVHGLIVMYEPSAVERQKIIDVAKRLYSAADMWMLDELEKEQGLPQWPVADAGDTNV